MNPYLNSNQATPYPTAAGTYSPIPQATFTSIRVSGPAILSCSIHAIRCKGGRLTVCFGVQQQNQGVLSILFDDIPANSSAHTVAGAVHMLIATGILDTDFQFSGSLLLDPCVVIPYSLDVDRYTELTLDQRTYKAPDVLSISCTGYLEQQASDNTLYIEYSQDRPALQLCADAALLNKSGVRSINGVHGRYLDIQIADNIGTLQQIQPGKHTVRYVLSSIDNSLGCV